MNDKQKMLVLSVLNNKSQRVGKISDEEFLALYPSNCIHVNEFVSKVLSESYASMDAESVEFSLYIGFHFGFSNADEFILDQLLMSDFHCRHADVVRALVLIKASSNDTVDALFNCALKEFDYLSDDRDNGIYSLPFDCIHALAKIKTIYAGEKIKVLFECDNYEVRNKAMQLMDK
ncbi:hypothetical protein LWP45_004649 [Escherichia coli]|uniref:hypothetical protein n=1 Tax=Escherichia coli TaxID=562 RepID=UPI000390F4E4|nr:hypothetical protein [Escherichia coli]EEW2611980.1 hypothetical protein [Escherichia coli]EFF0681842.1 hypothetical protein [Escherichia coli]EFH4666476.1 hypothetical protein [Escherichia coli]EFL3018479.1 hypothetical protein [Escherichia coli]EFM0287992.1 hypothetical protein [Escherichia coli]